METGARSRHKRMQLKKAMKHFNKRLLTTLLILLTGTAIQLQATVIYSAANGNWDNSATWTGGHVPGPHDRVYISHEVTATGGRVVGSTGRLTVSTTGKFILRGGLDVYGKFTIIGVAEVSGGLENYGKTTINGNLKVYGDWENRAGTTYNYGDTWTDSDLTNHGGASWKQDGVTYVQGDLENEGFMYGCNGMFRVCGDAEHEGVIEGIIYLCMECDGEYEDDGQGTFVLACNPFPVVFADFNGQRTKSGVKLNWVTASETNSQEFRVERAVRSVAGQCSLGVCSNEVVFSQIGTVPAAGQSSTNKKYTYTDENPGAGVNFYRLKMVDRDGHYDYSYVIQVMDTEMKENLQVYPNPNNDILYIRVITRAADENELNIYDIRGRKVWDKQLDLQPGEEALVELPIRNYSAGTYIVEFKTGNKKLTEKVIFFK